MNTIEILLKPICLQIAHFDSDQISSSSGQNTKNENTIYRNTKYKNTITQVKYNENTIKTNLPSDNSLRLRPNIWEHFLNKRLSL